MGNCLVTKLKGIVQNDNLPKFGELTVNFLHTSGELEVYNTQGCTISSNNTAFKVRTSKGVVIENVNSYVVQANDTSETLISITNGGTLKVSNKYALTYLRLNNCFAEGIKYLPITFLQNNGEQTYKISDYINPNTLKVFKNYCENAEGSLINLGNCVHLDNIDTGTAAFNGITRAIIDGDWLDFVVAQVKHGRTTGTIKGGWSAALFNSKRLNNDANYRLSWSSSGNNYLVTYISGNSLDNPSTNLSVTIDANGNVI